MTVISISAPDTLIDQVDHLAEAEGYAGRSEFIRAALREFMQNLQQQRGGDGRRSATVTLSYREGAERRVANTKHEFTDIITSMMHSHTGDTCLEVLMVDGDADAVRRLANGLRSIREVQTLNVFYVE